MTSHAPPPLDEIRHSRPEIISWYVNTGGQPMGEGMMHVYLAESPFFDHSSKNGLHFTHAQNNPAVVAFMQDRKRFEEDLRRHVGVEYLIVGEPLEVDRRVFVADGKGGGGGRVEVQGRESSGVWVFRKQDRQRRRGNDGRVQEEVETLGTYYCVGEGMYQAPAVGDVVGNKLLSATTHLNKFFGTAKELPSFDPTRGYTYLPQSTSVPLPGASSRASPARSREGSILPSTNPTTTLPTDSQSLRSQSLLPDSSQTSNTTPSTTKFQETALLARSFKQSLEFADEFTDENPLVGEPGHFSFTSSLAAVSARKRKAAEEEAMALAAKANKAAAQQQAVVGRDAAVKVEEKGAVNEPPAVMSSAQVREVVKEGQKERRGSRMGGEKKRRTKSKAHLGSLVGVAEGGAT